VEKKKFTYYEEDGSLVGWLDEFPDYRTQGATLEELRENLLDIFQDVTSGDIPCVRKSGELEVA